MNINLTKAKVLVTTSYKYTSKTMSENWLHLMQYANGDEFKHACLELHQDESDPQLLYFDFEDIPGVYITEKWICPELFDLIKATAKLEINEHQAFSSWVNHYKPELTQEKIKTLLNAFKYNYEGIFSNKYRFGRYYAKSQLGITEKNNPDFDFTGYTDHLFDTDSMFLFIDGYVFKNIPF
ncbi:antirestriction protein ArdA [Dysgonomonas sp. ZJ709]|uniref:antirestriction protein ArdA n=1 Tax=Dysgonomonas sp. ZJ709 TaxID=2709797 RepID=UPI0013EA995E|nr:antirestriction protein ArdA [Dysgonomonas sp. ZJ709]